MSYLYVILQFFNKSFTHSGTVQLIICLEILKRYCRLTYYHHLPRNVACAKLS
jgi:hypothetical protein